MNDAAATASTLPPPSTERQLGNAVFMYRDTQLKLDALKAEARDVERRLLGMASVETDIAARIELVELAKRLELARGAR